MTSEDPGEDDYYQEPPTLGEDVRRYDSETADGQSSLLHARNGGVITLLFVESLSEDRQLLSSGLVVTSRRP